MEARRAGAAEVAKAVLARAEAAEAAAGPIVVEDSESIEEEGRNCKAEMYCSVILQGFR